MALATPPGGALPYIVAVVQGSTTNAAERLPWPSQTRRPVSLKKWGGCPSDAPIHTSHPQVPRTVAITAAHRHPPTAQERAHDLLLLLLSPSSFLRRHGDAGHCTCLGRPSCGSCYNCGRGCLCVSYLGRRGTTVWTYPRRAQHSVLVRTRWLRARLGVRNAATAESPHEPESAQPEALWALVPPGGGVHPLHLQ
ncbi:hypothetical protein BU14_0565s0004 [Porphyra umbilicalis]|uniref:Uncharacterized protein n=1 Tax=Porphyra umbilicalis TaxID=2786 RepID=A0A1X6NSB5_PORUM|nr:hypothetical protein BU14_0565s0004 [Porphyra umbilicalis]|eukprot:OSX71273.1 hypothetical protein BU14_0565s0004 [Porphyra umbilicalis]